MVVHGTQQQNKKNDHLEPHSMKDLFKPRLGAASVIRAERWAFHLTSGEGLKKTKGQAQGCMFGASRTEQQREQWSLQMVKLQNRLNSSFSQDIN